VDTNEIARKLQALLSQYEACRVKYADRGQVIADATAAHFLATDIGYLVTDIDAEVARERHEASERERYAPSGTDAYVSQAGEHMAESDDAHDAVMAHEAAEAERAYRHGLDILHGRIRQLTSAPWRPVATWRPVRTSPYASDAYEAGE
jgi:hypothetical protein